MKYITYNKKNRGVSLLLTILIFTAILSIAFGTSTLMFGELKMSKDVSNSLKAYYAAESGAERKLYEVSQLDDNSDIGSAPDCFTVPEEDCLDLDACYAVGVTVGNPIIIKSYGCYKDTRRSIEIEQPILPLQ